MDLSLLDHALAALAAVAAGVVNAVAGGGTLITFPALVALGVPTVSSNVTNTVALCPGYFGGTLAQRQDLVPQRPRLVPIGVAAAVGGVAGSALLVASSEDLFRAVVPFLLLGACALLAAGERIKRSLPSRRSGATDAAVPAELPVTRPSAVLVAAVFATAVYGGYFGAGMGIVTLAVVGLAVPDSMVRVNGLKQFVTLLTNITAAVFFVFSGLVVWSLVAVMAPASLLGGSVGGRLVRRLNPALLRGVVIVFGVTVAVRFLLD